MRAEGFGFRVKGFNISEHHTVQALEFGVLKGLGFRAAGGARRPCSKSSAYPAQAALNPTQPHGFPFGFRV